MPSTSKIKSDKQEPYPNGKLIIAAAGSGKTTYIVKEALAAREKLGKYERILITTYTENNAEEINKKIISKNRFTPSNIIVQTWFSFLLQHGVRPYQDTLFEELWDKRIKGVFFWDNLNKKDRRRLKRIRGKEKNGKTYNKEYFFTKDLRIYTDTLSKFVYRTLREEREEKENFTLSRIKGIFPKIYIDEMQDLAGYDLNFVELLLKEGIEVVLVGDPRQRTYLTNYGKKNKLKDGSRKDAMEFFKDKIEIYEKLLNGSHRNCKEICDFANRIHGEKFKQCESKVESPDFESPDFDQKKYNEHKGIWIVHEKYVEKYTETYAPKILRDSKRVVLPPFVKTDEVLNFGASKGLTFDRVLVYPTDPIKTWLKNPSVPFGETSENKTDQAACRFYVAVTRARYSVAFVVDETTFNKLQSPKRQNFIDCQQGELFAPEQKHEPALPYNFLYKFFDPSEDGNCA